MGSVPVFLLKKLYMKGSLKNTVVGFELTIQNTLAPGTIVGLVPLQVDDIEYPLVHTGLILPDGRKVSAADICVRSSLHFDIGDKVTIKVEGKALPAGLHKLMISLKTKEVGTVQILAEDTIC